MVKTDLQESISHIIHEIKSPLISISAICYSAKKRLDSTTGDVSEVSNKIAQIETKAVVALERIELFGDYYRVKEKLFEFHPEYFDVNIELANIFKKIHFENSTIFFERDKEEILSDRNIFTKLIKCFAGYLREYSENNTKVDVTRPYEKKDFILIKVTFNNKKHTEDFFSAFLPRPYYIDMLEYFSQLMMGSFEENHGAQEVLKIYLPTKLT